MEIKSNDTSRKLQIIHAISSADMPKMKDIHDVTKIPVSTIKRLLPQIKADLGVEIEFVGGRGRTAAHGGIGYYRINSWGVIDRFQLPLFITRSKV